jgi:hypothetical protein
MAETSDFSIYLSITRTGILVAKKQQICGDLGSREDQRSKLIFRAERERVLRFRSTRVN